MISSEKIYEILNIGTARVDPAKPEERIAQAILPVELFYASSVDPNKFIEFIVELFDPAYGIARKLPEPWGSELLEFCKLVKAGKFFEAINSVRSFAAVGNRSFDERKLPETYTALGRADKATIMAVYNAATLLAMNNAAAVLEVSSPGSLVAVPMFDALRLVLDAHKDEFGIHAMEAMARRISDRLAETLNSK